VQPFTTARVLITLSHNASAPIAAPSATFLVTVSSVSNSTVSDSAVFTIVYADLHVSSEANATRAGDPSKGNIVEKGPLTTPGFDVGVAGGALAVLAVAVRIGRGGRRR
jgi:hypothetical protein